MNYAAEVLGVESKKMWMSVSDNRTRDSHRELNRVIVGRKEKFPNGLMYPGDRSGRPEEVYNCRCSLGSVLPEMLEDFTGDGMFSTGNTVESYNKWLEEKQAEQQEIWNSKSGGGWGGFTNYSKSDNIKNSEGSYTNGIGSADTNFDIVKSNKYKRCFDTLTDNPDVNNAIYKRAKAAVTHQSGGYKEDLSVISLLDGKLVGKSSNKDEYRTIYTQKIKNAMSEYGPYELISVHNHGTNLPPTGADLVSAGSKKYKFGIVACNDGSVYYYSVENVVHPFTAEFFDRSVENYMNDYGATMMDSMIATLDSFSERYGIEWRKLN